MKNLFVQVNHALESVYPVKVQPKSHAKKRLNTLTGLICGMIRRGKSTLSDIGSGIARDIDAHSKTTAAKRFLENKWTDYTSHYLPFILAFLKGILPTLGADKPIYLAIDGSDIGKHNAALMISLVWKNRGIPICWLVKKGNKGHFKVQDHVKLMQKAQNLLLPLLDPKQTLIVLGDGEFDGIDLFKRVLSKQWNYVSRTAANTSLYERGQRFRPRDITVDPKHNVYFIPHIEFTQRKYKWVNFVYWHDKNKHKDPIFLVSNLEEPGDIIEAYKHRYSIEALFKDIKSTSFNVHKTRLKDAGQVANLLIIAALAFVLLILIAMKYRSIKYRKKVHRIRTGQKNYSFFFFAYLLFKYFSDNDIPFCISFQISKNSS